MSKISKISIKNSLLKQMVLLGKDQDHYIDMINDYMSLWYAKESLAKDIRTRGVTFRDFSSVGIEMQKNNPSVKELVMVNRQMLSILKELGLNDPGQEDEADEL